MCFHLCKFLFGNLLESCVANKTVCPYVDFKILYFFPDNSQSGGIGLLVGQFHKILQIYLNHPPGFILSYLTSIKKPKF